MLQHSIKLDLHTHSILSYDGGISERGYTKLLKTTLDVVAITDHNTIDFALFLQKKLGDRIIVGEEIDSNAGEVIGLFLRQPVVSGLSFEETAKQIHRQGGLVYIPHPFEHSRHSLSRSTFLANAKDIDIVELFNARSFGRKKESVSSKVLLNIPYASSSDAHCSLGVGSAYTMVSEKPTPKTLKNLLLSGKRVCSYAPFISYLCPFVNKLRKKINV